MVTEEKETEEASGLKENTKFRLSVPVKVDSTVTPISLEYESGPHRFNDRLRQVGTLIPELVGELTGVSGTEEEEGVLHEFSVTDANLADEIIYASDSVTGFRCGMKCSASYDGQVDLNYLQDTGVYATLASLVGNGSDIKQTLASASMLNGDEVVSPMPKYPFRIQIVIHTKASAGTCTIFLKDE